MDTDNAEASAAAPGAVAEGQPPEDYPAGCDALCARLRSSWLTLAESGEGLAGASSSLRDAPSRPETLAAARRQYEADTELLLDQPVRQFLRLQPIRRSLEAIEEWDRVAPARAFGVASALDRAFETLLARAAVDLCEPWRIWRGGNHEDEWRDWEHRRAVHQKKASTLLKWYTRRAAKTNRRERAGNQPKTQRLDTLWRQDRALVALLEMEVSFRDLALAWYGATEELAASMRQERDRIVRQAEQTLEWIDSGAEGDWPSDDALQPASPDERIRAWQHPIGREAERRLPERAELVTPRVVPRWHRTKPRESFLSAFARYGVPPVRQIVEGYWDRSAELMREVGRAIEILDYWREEPSAKGESLFADARKNAGGLLREQLRSLPAAEDLDRDLIHAFETWHREGFGDIEAAQYGWVALLRRPRGRRLLGVVVKSWAHTGQKHIQRGARWTSARWDGVLEQVGGKIPARPGLPPVVRRTTLRDTLALPASKSDLPGVYRLLFRISPVEDRRFLIGRAQELAGLQQAVKDWEEGRFAACLVIGARGSGKTSLLNCAEGDAFAGHSPIRGQFRGRALSLEAIDRFLRELLALEPGADLEAEFAARRRILVIEECERIYLRKVGGFEGAHYLIHLIHRTAPTTLWVIVMNNRALRVLDAGVQFGRVFSHRINAMNVSREDLENAILERHRLSGLRLRFAAPPASDPRVGRVRHWIGLHDSPQKLFFDSLFQQSAGVFRSAFELWLSSIDRVEGEDVKIRQPLDPSFASFRSELAQEDRFTLLAIQEHGSLTADELAEVLCEERDVSRSRLDRLFALGLIETDPDHPGLRVRPEAQRFVDDSLRRSNLT